MEFTNTKPERSLVHILKKSSGRDSAGHVSIRGQGGGSKKYLRKIDFFRDKLNIVGNVKGIEYDPNRTAYIAFVQYEDGDKRYILMPEGLKVGDKIIAGDNVDIKIGNCLPIKNIPVGTMVHNIEIQPGKGAQLIRSAGGVAQIVAKEGDFAHVKFPSGEIKKVSVRCKATVGQVGNIDWKNTFFGKAGRKRRLGIRPTVRGVAQNPRSHPHGGGEGRSGIGLKSPKSPWGKRTLGKKTRRKIKYSDKYIITRRK